MTARLDRRDTAALGGLLALGVALPLAMAAAAGAIGVRSDDAWVYALGADALFRTGTVTMPPHTASAVGQVVLVQPLLWVSGGAAWAYAAFGLLAATVGLGSTYVLARFYLAPRRALLASLLVVAFPGFGRQSVDFMTDVPAFAFAMLCLVLGTTWLRSGRRAALAASLVVGVIGVTIREFVLAAPVAILFASWIRFEPRDRVTLVVSSLLTAGAVAVILFAVRSAAVQGGVLAPEAVRLYLLGPALTTAAAVVLPVAVCAVAARLHSFRPLHVVAAAGLVVVAFVIPTIGPLVGQFWMPDGLVGNALLSGTRQPVIPPALWELSEALAILAAGLMALLTVRWAMPQSEGVNGARAAWTRALELGRAPAAPVLLFLVGYVGELGLIIVFGVYPLDRYLYPLVPVTAILLLREGRDAVSARRLAPLSAAALLWLGLSALVINANSFAYDAARWRTGEAAVAAGYAPSTVDAGYDWVGFHGGAHLNAVSRDYGVTWYDDLFMPAAPCAVVSNTPLAAPGFTQLSVDEAAYRQYLFAGSDRPLYLYGSTDARCPAPAK